MKNKTVINLIEFIKFMIKLLEESTLDKKKETSSMDKEGTSFRKEGLIMKDNGGITRWKEKAKLILERDNLNTLENGKLMNIMAGAYCIQILLPHSSGFHMKVSSKTVWNKEEDKWSSKTG